MSSHVVTPGTEFKARIQQVEQTPSGVVLVWLYLMDQFDHTHRPGQYLQLNLDGEWSFFSIASLPLSNTPLELHIQTNQQEKIQFLLDAFADQRIIEIKCPYGVVNWKSGLTDGMFLARGTGFAPVKGLIEAAFDRDIDRKIHLCWEGECASDVYFLNWLQGRLASHQNFSATLYATENSQGLVQSTGIEHKAGSIASDFQQRQGFAAQLSSKSTWYYLCASPAKVYQWVDSLTSEKIPLEHMSSDAFEYAPR